MVETIKLNKGCSASVIQLILLFLFCFVVLLDSVPPSPIHLQKGFTLQKANLCLQSKFYKIALQCLSYTNSLDQNLLGSINLNMYLYLPQDPTQCHREDYPSPYRGESTAHFKNGHRGWDYSCPPMMGRDVLSCRGWLSVLTFCAF